MHKHRKTGGVRHINVKKRKYLLGRQPANTKLTLQLNKKQVGTVVHRVRCRGGNIKFRALRLNMGNFSWGTEGKLETKINRMHKKSTYI